MALIDRQAAITIPVMPKEHRHYQTNNLDDAYEQGWNDLQECIENLPPVQPKHGKWKPRYYDVGADTYVEWACSECGYVRQKGREDGNAGEEPEADFCEKCGVKMER